MSKPTSVDRHYDATNVNIIHKYMYCEKKLEQTLKCNMPAELSTVFHVSFGFGFLTAPVI